MLIVNGETVPEENLEGLFTSKVDTESKNAEGKASKPKKKISKYSYKIIRAFDTLKEAGISLNEIKEFLEE